MTTSASHKSLFQEPTSDVRSILFPGCPRLLPRIFPLHGNALKLTVGKKYKRRTLGSTRLPPTFQVGSHIGDIYLEMYFDKREKSLSSPPRYASSANLRHLGHGP
ncbi:hypothetical protein AVEN_166222-1 [Araneus ventricosus]|uniref:Uncharacterized protein n=1 Tax=Araneus ventricosus TaxID=182803 RepID=A0A4Y2FRH3_ARAVE|nr:hypothetical protein AVEN_166222-1 [Araneus ventricosus]